MSNVITAVRRQFKYNGNIIISPEQDPGPEFSPGEILEHLKTTGIFPELAKSEIEIRETTLADDLIQVEFVKKAGTKGAVAAVIKPERIEALPQNSMKMARGDDEDIDALRGFLLGLEEKIEEECGEFVFEAGELSECVESTFEQLGVGMRWRRVVEGFSILRDTCTDPNLSYLEWKPELLALTTAYDALLESAQFALSVMQANFPVEASEFMAISKLQAAIALAGPEIQTSPAPSPSLYNIIRDAAVAEAHRREPALAGFNIDVTGYEVDFNDDGLDPLVVYVDCQLYVEGVGELEDNVQVAVPLGPMGKPRIVSPAEIRYRGFYIETLMPFAEPTKVRAIAYDIRTGEITDSYETRISRDTDEEAVTDACDLIDGIIEDETDDLEPGEERPRKLTPDEVADNAN